MKKFTSIENSLIPAVFLVILIFFWEAIVQLGYLPKYILPAPSDVFKVLINNLSEMQQHVLVTLGEAFTGFIVAILLALLLSVLMDYIPALKMTFYPLILISQTIPIIALAPLFVIWFGFGYLPKIIVVVLVCFFPILISLLEGLASVDTDLLNLMRAMGASKGQTFRIVKFPAAMVNFFSGLRIAATYSIMGAVIGEWLGGEKGLGVYMIRVKHSYALDKMFAAILIIVISSMLVFKSISFLQNLLMPWNQMKE